MSNNIYNVKSGPKMQGYEVEKQRKEEDSLKKLNDLGT